MLHRKGGQCTAPIDQKGIEKANTACLALFVTVTWLRWAATYRGLGVYCLVKLSTRALSRARGRLVITITAGSVTAHSAEKRILRTLRPERWIMAQAERETLELLKFELKFLEDGGYGRSPRTPWRAPRIFEDSPSCLNFNDPSRPHPCPECALMQFVPEPCRDEPIPCRFIPLGPHGEDVDYFYRCATQPELEEALTGWLRKQISLFEEQREAPSEAEHSSGIDPLRRQQWLALAGNLYLLGNLRCENHNYEVAHALYTRALAAAEKVAPLEDNGRSLVARIQRNQQAVSEILNGGESRVEQAESEELQTMAQ